MNVFNKVYDFFYFYFGNMKKKEAAEMTVQSVDRRY
jgi:hypothetical protein